MKIYTRTGDSGETGLLGGQRVRKDVLRVEVLGEVDELNACLGFARAAVNDPGLVELLHSIQRDLFAVAAQTANAREKENKDSDKTIIAATRVRTLEHWIDRFDEELPPLKNFILPSGCEAGVRLHMARTVCRRAERRIAALAETEVVSPIIPAYMNRLSDLLFMMARLVNHRVGAEENTW